MALSAENRSRLYESFTGVIGKEATETLLAQFPAHDGDQPITRDYLRGEMADLGGELRSEMADLRVDLRSEISDVKGELHTALATQQRTMLGWMITIVLAVNGVTFALGQAIA